MSVTNPSSLVEPFVERAVRGDSRPAVDLVLGLLDRGVPAELIITDLLAAAQRHVGDLWHANQLNVADEHLATGVAETALHALAAAGPVGDMGLVVVVCAEGDWHGIAAHMFAEQLRAYGTVVAYLGASAPADHIALFVERHRPDALAVSCNLPLFYAGLARLADVAHAHGVPVLAGGRALTGATTAAALGADGWTDNLADSLEQLASWRETTPPVRAEPTILKPAAVILDASAEAIASAAFEQLGRQFPAMTHYGPAQLARTREDLAFIVKFAAAAMLIDEPAVLTDFLDWLVALLAARNVPQVALYAGLETLQPGLTDAGAGHLATLGLSHLAKTSSTRIDSQVPSGVTPPRDHHSAARL